MLWPRFLEDANAPPWRVTFLDDSNNEPSVTISCGGGSTCKGWPWLVDRTMTLGATSLREDISVTHLLTGEASFEVFEVSRVLPAHERIVEELKLQEAAGRAGGAGAVFFQPKRLSGGALPGMMASSSTAAGTIQGAPGVVRVELPGTGWSASQRWGVGAPAAVPAAAPA